MLSPTSTPLSIMACKSLGITEDDLIHLSLEDYIKTDPDAKGLPKDLQQERYDNYDKNRNQLIEDAKKRSRFWIGAKR